MISEQELLRKQKEITSAKNEISELKGQEKVLLKRLNTEWKCKTVGDAKKKVLELEDQIEELEDQITTLSKELEINYLIDEEE